MSKSEGPRLLGTVDSIEYWIDREIDLQELAMLFDDSGIRRPTKDLARLEKMITNANLNISAWAQGQMLGIARSLTDFSFCCYLSDLAVRKQFQKKGIGKNLVRFTQEVIGPQTMLLLLSAPEAMEYYPKIGFEPNASAFSIARQK